MKQTMIIGSDGNSNYAVTDATRNITITGLPFTLEAKHVAYVFNQTQNLLLYAPIDGFPGITVSGGVITYDATLAALATGDELHIQLYPPNYGVDVDGFAMVKVLNPEYAHNTSPEALVADEDILDGVVTRKEMPFTDYKNAGIQISLFAATADDTAILTAWITNDADADDSSDVGWIDDSTELLGAANITANASTEESFHWIDTDKVCLKMMIRIAYSTTSGGVTENNACDVLIVKA